MGLFEDSGLPEGVHQWSGPRGDLYTTIENGGQGLVGVFDRPRRWKEDWNPGTSPDPEEAARLRDEDPLGRRMEQMEDDRGVAADWKEEDHFGRREERQEGASPGHVVGIHPLPIDVKERGLS